MLAGRLVWVIALVAGCGSVSQKSPDAKPVDTKPIDVPIDMSSGTAKTAIAADNLTSFSATNNAWTKVPYAETYDDNSEFSSGTFTPKAAGDYYVCASIDVGVGGLLTLDLYKNGARQWSFASGQVIASGCTSIRVAAGDAIDVYVFQGSGSNATVNPEGAWDWLTISAEPAMLDVNAHAMMNLSNATYTKVPFDTEVYDDASEFNTTTNRFTVTQAGDYHFCASYYLGFGNVPAQMDLYLNGVRTSTLSFGVGGLQGCRTLRLAVSDSVEVNLYQSSGSTFNSSPTDVWDWVTASKSPALVSVAGITPFSLPAATYTKVPYTTELFDDNGRFDISTSTFTPASAGDYRICAELLTSTAADGDELDIYKNGAREKGLGYGQRGVGGCRVLRLTDTDQIQIFARSPGALSFSSDVYWDWFEASKIR